jgi:hypothetical protein
VRHGPAIGIYKIMSARHVLLILCLLGGVAGAQPAHDEAPPPSETAPAEAAPAEPPAAEPAAATEPTATTPGENVTPERLRELVRTAKAKVLERMEIKITEKAADKMSRLGALIRWFSLAGLLLLLMPLFLRKRAPGQGKRLFGYSALAAITFVVTVNLFGMVVVGFRSAQAALGSATNPQLHIASGFFDTLDQNADELVMFGSQLFGPTLEQLQGDSDEPPVAILIENGKNLVKDADVFVTIAKAFKKLDFVFGALPTILLIVTMALFVVAMRPTLTEIVKLPMAAASGANTSGKKVVAGALRRVGGELLATVCTIGVLVVLTLLAGAILGRVVGPALDALIAYFTLAVLYLQQVSGASSGLVFGMLFSVILFLVLNLAAVILSMSFFLGKSQKIFQRRFHDGVPVRAHARFWKWGSASLLVALLFPWLYIVVAEKVIDAINGKLTSGVTEVASIPWTAIMLIGPGLLVVGFVLLFWVARGIKALKFLAKYKPAQVPGPNGP